MPLDSKVRLAKAILTGDERDRLEFLLPGWRHFDEVSLLFDVGCGVPKLVRVVYDGLHVVASDGVEDVECVVSIGKAVFGQLLREVAHQVPVLLDHRPHVLDTEFVILGHVDELDFGHLEKPFALGEDILEEVLVDHGCRRDVELHCVHG